MDEAQATMGTPPPNEDLNKSVVTKADLLEKAVNLVGLLSQENKKLRQMLPSTLSMTPAMMYQNSIVNQQMMMGYPGQMMMPPYPQYGTYPQMTQQPVPPVSQSVNLDVKQKSANLPQYPQNMGGWMMPTNGATRDNLGNPQSYHWSCYPESVMPLTKKIKVIDESQKIITATVKESVVPDSMKADSEFSAISKPQKSSYAQCA
jgi:hypothetical protein